MPSGLKRFQQAEALHFLTFSWRVAPIPMTFRNHAEGAPGRSPLGTPDTIPPAPARKN